MRAETAKQLGILAAKKKATKPCGGMGTVGIETRAARPKIRRDKLNDPPKPKSKFRKRQIHKTWLPTHLWHAKRATMTEPKKPLWRFAIPLTSTEKSYRPTHRAGGASGAIAWDMSYMSTIGLEGSVLSLEKLLKQVGVTDENLWNDRGVKWRFGRRSWSGWLSRKVNDTSILIGPSTILWSPTELDVNVNQSNGKATKAPVKRIFIRIHPAIFLETWTEILQLSKLQRPGVHVEDLRFEIGSIDITGPGSTEALLGILHPFEQAENQDEHAKTFRSLAGLTNASSLPLNSILCFPILDPRLRSPPRPVALPKANDESANFSLLEMLSTWPVDKSTGSPALFDRDARFRATRLPAQKSLNRRKALAAPGDYPSVKATDPPIPIILIASRAISPGSSQGTWTLLAPWKCILPIWYGLMHYPLSSGKNPRFGGLQELRQIHFEHGVPWFPADFLGTHAGSSWELEERAKRKAEWGKRPKGKRIEWGSLDLGNCRKGEIGDGWACDYERAIGISPVDDVDTSMEMSQETEASTAQKQKATEESVQHLSSKSFTKLLSVPSPELPSAFTISTVCITLVTRGVASPCARIYRLPAPRGSQDSMTTSSAPATTREEWLGLLPQTSTTKPLPNPKRQDLKNIGRVPLNTPLSQRVRLLAQSLLQTPPLPYPAEKVENDGFPLVPDEEDLIGFVTTGEFNLAEGKGVAIGNVLVRKVLEGLRGGKKSDRSSRLCIVRNAGEKIGRLARWEVV
jgi:ribonuclease P/MRP protein subunit POP1